MVDHLETYCTDHGVRIHKNTPINLFEPSDSAHGPIRLISGETSSSLGVFDVVISSLPSPILASVATPVLHATEVKNLSSLRYLSALNLIVETEEPVFDKEYWVSVCVEDMPNLVFVQHTNFVSKSHYNDKHILYIAGYYEDNDPIMSLSKQQVLDLLLPQIQKVRGTQPRVGNTYVWKARHAQPVFDAQFLAHMPTMQTSHPRLLVANLDMTYPFDRGTNHAVRLGIQVTQKIPKTT